MSAIEKITGNNLEGESVTLSKSEPYQLSLFQTFLDDGIQYSNTIDLYDAVPKYFASTKKMETIREGGKYLPILTRTFKHKDFSTGKTSEYLLEIKPARIQLKGGQEKEYYPTEREELVEEALRKIACEPSNGMFIDKNIGVQFTLYQLQQELKKRGHSIKYPSLVEALTICNTTNICIKTVDGTTVLKSSIFPLLLITSREQWLENPKAAKCYVQFNALITRSLKTLDYRQFNYGKLMEYKKQLSRWLHKRLSRKFVYAGIDKNYSIRASTIIRDSGLVNNAQMRDQIKAIDTAFEELKAKRVLREIHKHLEYQGRKIIDAKYELIPTHEFSCEMKVANARKNSLLSKAEQDGNLKRSVSGTAIQMEVSD